MALDDDQPLSGAQFSHQVGADPEKWAARFLVAYGEAALMSTRADRQAFVAAWFRDAMEAAVKAAGVHGVLVEPWDQQRTVAQILEEERRRTGKPSD